MGKPPKYGMNPFLNFKASNCIKLPLIRLSHSFLIGQPGVGTGTVLGGAGSVPGVVGAGTTTTGIGTATGAGDDQLLENC